MIGSLRPAPAKLLLAITFSSFVLGACGGSEDYSLLRVVHLDPLAKAIDVGVDGKGRVRHLSYANASPYFEVNPSSRRLRVIDTSAHRPLVDLKLTLSPMSRRMTGYLLGLSEDADAPLFLTDDKKPPRAGVLLRVVHAVVNLPALRVSITPSSGEPLARGISYRHASDYVEIPFSKKISLAIDDERGQRRFFEIANVHMTSGSSYTIVIFGRYENAKTPMNVFILEDGGRGDKKAATELANARVMLIHASPGSDDLALGVDGKDPKDAPIPYPEVTPYQSISAGRHRIDLHAKTGNAIVLTKQVALAPGRRYTVIAAGIPSKIEGLIFEDPLLQPEIAGRARLRFLNIAPDAPTIDVQIPGDTALLFSDTAYAQATPFTSLPSKKKLSFEIRSSENGALLTTLRDVELKDGKSYSIYTIGRQETSDFTTRIHEHGD